MRRAKHIGFAVLVAFSAGSLAFGPAREKPTEATVQVKLRDLLDLAPRKDAGEIKASLKRIEDRLAAIEILLMTPRPLAGPPK